MADTNYYVDGDAGNDANAGTSAGAAKATIQAGLNLCVGNGDICNLKARAASATYDLTTGLTTPAGANFTGVQRLRGYGATIGDGVQAKIKATAGSFTMFSSTGQGWLLQDIELDGNLQTSIRGVTLDGLSNGVHGCTVRRCTNSALNNVRTVVNTWVKDNTTAGAVIGATYYAYGCAFTGNADVTPVSPLSDKGSFVRCLFVGNTGTTTDGLATAYNSSVIASVFYANGRHGLYIQNYPGSDGPAILNVFTHNGGYGLACGANSHGAASVPGYDYNAFGSGTQGNTSGSRNNMDAGLHDVTLGTDVDPYVDAANWATKTTLADLFAAFAPNTTAGGGALLRAAGFPAYLDLGTVQHQDAGGSSGPAAILRVFQNIGTY